MNIIIYNGNLKPPYFINLLANKLCEKGHAVFLVGTARKLMKFKIDKLIQNIIFIFKIQIECTISNTGFPSYLGDGGLMKSEFCKHGSGTVEYLMIFFRFIFLQPYSTSPGSNE